MRVKYKNSDKLDTQNSVTYYVLAYGDWDVSTSIYLLPDDNIQIIEPCDKGIIITDNNLDGYIRRDDLNYGKKFYLDEKLNDLVLKANLKTYHEIKEENNLWVSSKLAPFFIQNSYIIPESYKNSILNEKYKRTLIEGFLKFVNNYVNFKHKGCSYQENFRFEELGKTYFDSLENCKKLDIKKYKELLLIFISETLYLNAPNEDCSKDNSKELYLLIDSIFLNEISSIFESNDFYDNYFIIEYENQYYALIKDWGS